MKQRRKQNFREKKEEMWAERLEWSKRLSQIHSFDYSVIDTAVVSDFTQRMKRTGLPPESGQIYQARRRQIPQHLTSNDSRCEHRMRVCMSGQENRTLMCRWRSSIWFVLFNTVSGITGHVRMVLAKRVGNVCIDTQNLRKGETVTPFSVLQNSRLNTKRFVHISQYLLL